MFSILETDYNQKVTKKKKKKGEKEKERQKKGRGGRGGGGGGGYRSRRKSTASDGNVPFQQQNPGKRDLAHLNM